MVVLYEMGLCKTGSGTCIYILLMEERGKTQMDKCSDVMAKQMDQICYQKAKRASIISGWKRFMRGKLFGIIDEEMSEMKEFFEHLKRHFFYVK